MSCPDDAMVVSFFERKASVNGVLETRECLSSCRTCVKELNHWLIKVVTISCFESLRHSFCNQMTQKVFEIQVYILKYNNIPKWFIYIYNKHRHTDGFAQLVILDINIKYVVPHAFSDNYFQKHTYIYEKIRKKTRTKKEQNLVSIYTNISPKHFYIYLDKKNQVNKKNHYKWLWFYS